jgi:hypothetical protein
MPAMRAVVSRTLAVALAAIVVAGGAPAAGGPSATSQPRVTGVLQQGKKLAAAAGTWVGSGTVALAFQWYRCDANAAHCSSVHGATRATYTQVAKDVGHTLGLTVRGTDSAGTTESYAPVAGVVAPRAAAVAPAGQPALAGDPFPGATLTVQEAAWTAKPSAVTVAWLRCNANGRACVTLAGQTGAAYAVAAADAGHTVLAVVTAAAGAARATVLSLRSAVIRTAPGPVALARPAVTGTLQQGKKLTASTGSWSSGGAIAYAYQWYRCDASGAHCSSIHGATKTSYTQVARDVGTTLGLTVRATDATGTTPAYAPLAGTVAAPASPLAGTVQPAVTGTPAVGATLGIDRPGWSRAPAATAYAWLRCNANGRACTTIDGRVGATYVVTAEDRGHVLVATVTGTTGATSATVWSTGAAVPS